MKKRWISIALVLLMVLTLLPFGAFADQAESELLYKIKDGAATVTGFSGSPTEKIVIPEKLGGAPVKAIGDDAFRDRKWLTEVELPDGMERIGFCAFYGSGLREINEPASLQEVGPSAFENTPLLGNERFWEDDIFYYGGSAMKVRGDGITYTIRPGTKYVYFRIENRDALTSVTFPDGLLGIGGSAFANAKNLKSVKLPDSLEFIGGSSFIRSGLTSIIIPPHVKSIGDSAFSECNLQNITLSGNELETIGHFAFYDNPLRMDTLKIPNSVKSVKTYAFNAGMIKELILSSSMTKLEDYSFAGSSWLQKLWIPASIQTIGEGALMGRLNENPNYPEFTTKVFYEGTESEWQKVKIKPCNELLDSMKVHCGAEPYVDPFIDVPVSQFYAKSVEWAVNYNPQITNGTDATHFSPSNPCTRGQVVTFLWRAAGEPAPSSTKNPFKDVSKDAYYYKAVLWAVEKGITNGTSATTFSPNAPCTRAHVVTFLYRSEGSPKLNSTKNPFKDLAKGEYYMDAVLWAVSKNITNGTDATHFSPANPCTRGQIVTFLYRDKK